MQQEYFHTPRVCLDLYFEIVMNLKNHERVETSVCFPAKSSKDSIHSIILENKSEFFFKYKEHFFRFTICDVAANYNTHTCYFHVFLRG